MTVAHTALLIVVYVFLLTLAIAAKSAAPWVRSKKAQRDAFCEGLDMPAGSLVYDIGSGDGAMLFDYARKHPGVRAVGIEIALLPFLLAVVTKWRGGATFKNVQLRYRDIFGQDFSDADACFLFLMPAAYQKMLPKLAGELRDDAVVVTEAWPFPNAVAERVIQKPGVLPMYVYRGRALREALANI